MKQCEAVNGKLVALKAIKGSTEQPDRRALLEEIFEMRGDELVEWNDMDAPEPEESDGSLHFIYRATEAPRVTTERSRAL